MNRTSGRHYFELSTLLALGLATLLLISMPGGCGDSEDGDDEESTSSEEVAEPTAPPMMDIVDPEPGDLNNEPVAETDDGEPPADGGEQPPESDEGQEGDANGTPDGVYVVQEGDTLYDIAVRYSVTMEALLDVNGMDDPNQLQVGQELQIPD